MLERIQKILSARGIASRRKAEEYIEQGLVLVNGKPAILGQKADPAVDRIEVKGEVLAARREMLYYLMNKPRGVVTTNIERVSPHPSKKNSPPVFSKNNLHLPAPSSRGGRGDDTPTVREILPKELQGKIFPVGRLDKDSEGLLLLTSDGVLAYRLTHPKFDHEKEYDVTVEGKLTPGVLRKLSEGVKLKGELTKPARIEKTGPQTFRIALTEGRNRQIRRMCQKVGCTVTILRRSRIMTLTDDRLPPGKIRPLTQQEKAQLLASIGL